MKAKPPTRKDKAVFVRVSKLEHEAFKREAWARGLGLCAWIRAVLLQKVGLEPKI